MRSARGKTDTRRKRTASWAQQNIVSHSNHTTMYTSNPALLQRLRDENRRANLDLVGLNGNAFALMAAFKRAAERDSRPKWTTEEVEAVLAEATSGDYNHLLGTLIDFCDPQDDEDDGDDNPRYGEDDYGHGEGDDASWPAPRRNRNFENEY